MIYVNSVSGSDANNGLSIGQALRTLTKAFSLVSGPETIEIVSAPESDPLRDQIRYRGAFDITINGNDGYLYGSEKQRAEFVTCGSTCLVVPNAASFTSDAQNSNTNDYYFVNDRHCLAPDPMDCVRGIQGVSRWEVATRRNGITNEGPATMILNDLNVRGTRGSGIVAGFLGTPLTCTMILNRCTAEYCGISGIATTLEFGSLTATDCLSRYNGNDGYNNHCTVGVAGQMTLNNCAGLWNGDEGVSSHDDCVLVTNGGDFSYNGSGGATHVNDAVVTHNGGTFNNNNQCRYSDEFGGIAFLNNVSGSINNTSAESNDGPGWHNESGLGISNGHTSNNNTDPDIP